MIKAFRLAVFFLLLTARAAWCATTPADAPLAEGDYTLIECMCPNETVYSDNTDAQNAKLRESPYHYQLYLPKGYSHSGTRKYPCVFVASPDGNAKLGVMKNEIDRAEWIAVCLVESKNASNLWLPNFMAAHDDAVKRVRIKEEWKFATGMSGGARVCSKFPRNREGFRGVFLQSAGTSRINRMDQHMFFSEAAQKHKYMLLYGSFGTTDMNLHKAIELRTITNTFVVKRLEIFSGGHNWAPEYVANNAFDWLEREILLEMPAEAADADIAKICYDRKTREHAAAGTAFKKYRLNEDRLQLLKRYLSKEATTKEETAKLAAEIAELEKLPEIQTELKARKAYQKVEEKETMPYEPLKKLFGSSRKKSGSGGKMTPPAIDISEEQYKIYMELQKKINRNKAYVPTKAEMAVNDKVFKFGDQLDKWRDQWRGILKSCADEYRKVAADFPDTVYGKLATPRAESLEAEGPAKFK